jgi:LCP family protein required for cell wall assembly
MVDIPRDSYIAGDQVNAHMAYGGPDRLRDVLEDYTGVAIDHFAVTTFQGLRAMVDAIGGVKVDIPSRMADPYSRAYFDPGLQRLTGQEALSFVRNRKSGVAGGDFGRTHNQGVLLRAAHAQLRKTNPSLGEMARFVAAFAQYTETDIPIPRLFKLATLAMAIKPSNVRQESLSGGIGSVGGASVVYLSGTEVFADINNGRIGP